MIKNIDLLFLLSGGATNTAPSASLGGVASFASIGSSILNNLFANYTTGELSSGLTDHACIYIWNDNAVDTMFDVTVAITKSPFAVNPLIPETELEIGKDPAGPGGTATTIGSRTSAPTGVTFDTTNLNLGDIGPKSGAALWIRRVVTTGLSVLQLDNFEITVTAQEA